MKRNILLFLLVFLSLISGCKADLNGHSDGSYEEIFNESDNVEETIEPSFIDIKVLAAGDMMFHLPQIYGAKTADGGYDFRGSFKYVKKYIKESDVSIGNFETVISSKSPSGYPRFSSPPQTLEAIKDAGFDIMSTANNHILDQGIKGIIHTIEAIEAQGMKNIGSYGDKPSPLMTDIDGIKLGFAAYTSSVNGLDSLLPKDKKYMVNRIDEESIGKDMEILKDQGADIIIVYLHWGYEYHREPSENQMSMAEKVMDMGADIILGSHPHVIQRTDLIEKDGKNKFIAYSMGNFLSNQSYETMGNSYTEDGVMIEMVIEKNLLTDEVRLKEVKYIPTWVYRYKENNKIRHEILPIEDVLESDRELPGNVISRMKKSLEDTLSVLNGNLDEVK